MNNPIRNSSVWARVAGGLCLLVSGAACIAASLPSASFIPSRTDGLIAPSRVAINGAGQLLVSDPGAGSVVTFDVLGRVSSVRAGLGSPLGLAVDKAGLVYVGDSQNGSVGVYDGQWNQVRLLGAGAGEFKLPGHIAVAGTNGAETIFVSDGLAHVVKAYRAGAMVGQYGSYGIGPEQFDFPAGICVGPDKNLYVVDQNNDRIQVLDQEGNFLRWFTLQSAAVQFGRSGRAQGVACDGAGRLYVADSFQGHLSVYDIAGTFLGTLGAYGTGAGEFRLPGGIAIESSVADGSGAKLWVANTGNGRVEGMGVDCYVQASVNPALQMVAAGSAVTFEVTTGCADGAVYQWFKDSQPLTDGAGISGAQSKTLVLSGVDASAAGKYSVCVTRGATSVLVPESQLLVAGLPVIVSSPASGAVVVGSKVELRVAASGSGLGYRWYYNGSELAVPSASSLVLTNVQLPDSGKYWVVVTNVAGSIASAQATLNVMVAPGIVSGPAAVTVAEHGTASFSVTANGSTPLNYQWYRGTTLLTGQTTNTITLTNISAAQAGSYYVRVSNAAAATNSLGAALTVIPDTAAPVALFAAGGPATARTILVSFSEAVNAASAQQVSKYQLMGPGDLSVVSAVVTNNSRVLLTLSGNRSAAGDYALRIQNVTDTASTPNTMSPNPAMLSVLVADSLGSVAWWPLNEGTGTVAWDATGNGFDGAMENATWIAGRSGSSANLNGTSGDVLIPALNLNTNVVTISAWVRRTGSQASYSGIVYSRGGSTIAGLNFGTTNELRYNWNNTSAAYNFSSGLVPPDGVWTFVALVVEPARAVLYLNSGSGLRSATNVTTHALEEFNGSSYIGWDSSASTRRFKGAIDDVRICNRALTPTQITAVYGAVALPASCVMNSPVSGSTVNAPFIPLSATVFSSGNAISKVEFFSGNNIIGAVRNPPYAFTWTNSVPGAYAVKARVYYGPSSYTADSGTISFNIVVPIVLDLRQSGTGLSLSWSGGNAPYQVQRSTNLESTTWENVGLTTASNSVVIEPTQSAEFYRVLGR